MLDAGLPLVECLNILSEHSHNRSFRTTLRQIRLEVEGGSTLHGALSKHPRTFDSLFVNMISAGEAGGVLDMVFKRLSLFCEKNVKLKRALRSASIYPSIVLALAIVIVCTIMIWVIPVFATLFRGLEAPLPLPTQLVLRCSNLIIDLSLPLVLAMGLAVLGLRHFCQTEEGRGTIDGMLLRCPLFGIVLRKIAISRFARTLSALLVSGLPILDGLAITAGTSGNRAIQDTILQARRAVEAGRQLEDSLTESPFFPPMVTQIIGVGERTGKLDQMLEKLADYFEQESDAAIANLLALLEPLMIIFLGVIIGGIVISMYLPIFSLIGRLSTGA
jgi:type IV pilus assembly protein PilC